MTREEFQTILNDDLTINGFTTPKNKFKSLKSVFYPNLIKKFLITLRSLEYYSSLDKNIWNRIIILLLKRKYRKYCHKLSFEIPLYTIGKGIRIHHQCGIIVNSEAKIGDYCSIRPFTVIGNKGTGKKGEAPIIGNNVDIGTNVCIIGKIKIGDNVKIGAGSVVIKDIPSNCVCAGNPARIIRFIKPK